MAASPRSRNDPTLAATAMPMVVPLLKPLSLSSSGGRDEPSLGRGKRSLVPDEPSSDVVGELVLVSTGAPPSVEVMLGRLVALEGTGDEDRDVGIESIARVILSLSLPISTER
jgi:hypothetical protein